MSSTTRRYHRKTKNGCFPCKKRHIKCDEGRPSCRNCTRASVSCFFEGEAPPHHVNVAEHAVASPTSSTASVSSSSGPPPHVAFDLLDLSLMHHYTISTSIGLFPGVKSNDVWQEVVPSQARSHPLLMHGLLAMASMDLARTKGSEQKLYGTRALKHQHAGTILFRQLLQNVHPDDLHILFVFAIILVILAFAFPQTCDEPPDIDGIIELLTLVRGCKIVWEFGPEAIIASPVAPLVTSQDAGKTLTFDVEIERRLDALRSILDDPADILAADQLLICVRKFLTESGHIHNLGRWPSMVSDAYWARMQNHQTTSLVVLAHWSVVLGRFQHLWWTSNWDSMLLRSIDATLSDREKEAVGWDLVGMTNFASYYKDTSDGVDA